MKPLKIAVLISGSGTNLQALIDACGDPDFPAEIVHVLSNKADAYGLERAQKAGIPTSVVSHKDFDSREAFDRDMHQILLDAGTELVCLAGFMRLLSPWFNEAWHDRMLNIHPSLLPDFKGINAQKQALEAGAKESGCTVHIVRPEMDSGPIIVQAKVPVLEDDTVETLTARILEQEHQCYPKAVRLYAEGKIKISGDTLEI